MSDAVIRWIDRWGLTACLVVAFVLRGLMICLQSDELTHDRDAYVGIARGIADGRGFCSPGGTSPTAFRPPLYPLLLGLLMSGARAEAAVAILNLGLGLLTVLATYRAGRLLGLGRVSLVAAWLAAIDPMQLQYTPQAMTEIVCTSLVALLLISLLKQSARTVWRDVLAGSLFGLLVLCRPTFWPLAGLVGVGFLFTRCWHVIKSYCGSGAGRSLDASSLNWGAGVGMLLVVAPWVIRNTVVMGMPILTTTHGGYTLLLANNPVFYDEVVDRPWGTVWTSESLARWQNDLDQKLKFELGKNDTEIERDRCQSRMARKFILAEPVRFVRAAWFRVRSLWSIVPQGEAAANSRWVLAAVACYYATVLLGFVSGMVVVARRGELRRWWMLYALVVTIQAVHLVYWTNARMRAPLMPVIALFAAAVLAVPAKSTSSDRQVEVADSLSA